MRENLIRKIQEYLKEFRSEKLYYIVISTAIILVFTFFVFISSLFGPSDLDNNSVKKIYYVDSISPAHRRVIELFNQRYKGQIEVEAVDLPFDKFSTNERKELLVRYLRSKSGRIDVFAVDLIWVPRFARWAVSLEEYTSGNQKDHLLQYSLNSCYYDGRLIATPLYIDIAQMYYRDDALKQLPDYAEIQKKIDSSISWEDFIALHQRLSKTGNPFFIYQADDFEGLICIFAELMESLSCPMVKNGKLQLHTPQAHRALQLLVDLVNKYSMSPSDIVRFKEDPSYSYFLRKNGVFLRGWSGLLDKPYVKEFKPNLRLAPVPHFRGYPPRAVFGGWNLMVSAFSTKIPEAVMFINFFQSVEAQKIMLEEGGYIPVNTKVYSDKQYVKNHPILKFNEKLLSTGFHRPFLENYTNISDKLSYYLNQAIRNKMPVSEALSRAEEAIEAKRIFMK